jgi:ribokinase
VTHVGKVGADGAWLVDRLAQEGIDTRFVVFSDQPTGQAIIQVDRAGENAIVLSAGANDEITPDEIDRALDAAPPGSWLLVQNETGGVAHAIRQAKARGLRVALNPAPMDQRAREYPLELVHLLCVNETEGAALSGEQAPERIALALASLMPHGEVLLTLGADGALYRGMGMALAAPAPRAHVVDSTAAGDTLLGYFLAGRAAGGGPQECLQFAVRAATLCVTRAGAMDSIPRRSEIGG